MQSRTSLVGKSKSSSESPNHGPTCAGRAETGMRQAAQRRAGRDTVGSGRARSDTDVGKSSTREASVGRLTTKRRTVPSEAAGILKYLW